MASNEIRLVVRPRSTAGAGHTQLTHKNRRNDPDRIRRHVEFREEC
ncbi:50S ribosomal protein L33 [Mycolicibacterium komossense]|uniref:Large ribosomal subunit protein bL33 n=1 Tax=Mycolicibacterium komossense TaxID=1779 RepID=A0ABT3CM11_9MYCO|nr:50S ribosomal protein L33 [Mycolicibacterium komossense]MCV7230520.1 50S ribosomal protein L33 [Mycolicibacterium komossense]